MSLLLFSFFGYFLVLEFVEAKNSLQKINVFGSEVYAMYTPSNMQTYAMYISCNIYEAIWSEVSYIRRS